MKFKSGQPGNPAGKSKGTKDRRTLFRELVENRREELVAKAVELALGGNDQMLRLLLDRLLPPRPREEPLQITTSIEGSLTQQGKEIFTLITRGQLTITEGTALLQSLGAQVKLIETDDLMNRIKKLEEISNVNQKQFR